MNQHRAFEVLIDDDKNKIIFIPALQKLFLVPIKTKIPKFIDSEKEAVICYSRPPDYKFRATHLIINNKCNLRCIYCYANAGERKEVVMPLEVAISAVERVAEDTKELGFDTFGVGLIGGEPTMSMQLVRQIIDKTRRIAKRYNLISQVGIVSNGVFREKVRNYIINNLDYITISLDGAQDIQDKHRPLRGGGGSFNSVFKNAKSIYDSGLVTGFRCTVSSYSVKRLSETVVFLHKHFPKSTIGIEPLQECGRCLTTETFAPDPIEYAENLIETIGVANEHDIKIKTSILRFKCQSNEVSFCGVNGQNFAVNPEGYITGCTRVTSKEDPMSAEFYYGKYDFEKKTFIFDSERYDWLKTLTVDNIDECKNCFARHNCKGDCPIVKSDFTKSFSTSKSPKCEAIQMVTRELFKMQLKLR